MNPIKTGDSNISRRASDSHQSDDGNSLVMTLVQYQWSIIEELGRRWLGYWQREPRGRLLQGRSEGSFPMRRCDEVRWPPADWSSGSQRDLIRARQRDLPEVTCHSIVCSNLNFFLYCSCPPSCSSSFKRGGRPSTWNASGDSRGRTSARRRPCPYTSCTIRLESKKTRRAVALAAPDLPA